ncbi:flagellar type III secretion system pore protein FliP [Nitrospirillum pindoramense]|uniref:Flagellar biosynthetic protein FliP n=1 Tax=Nitrospirillum amazonense TaxID=28077 RepID=A0A560H2K7_9PROT|nr:flagellar type III secretion system pore protein FliP [Nitrospirillum amazonense]TWB40542.1 flagellar biosynthetic protein FliP [Nitrospirillum amazonense]
MSTTVHPAPSRHAPCRHPSRLFRWGAPALAILLTVAVSLLAGVAHAQSLNLDLGSQGGSSTGRIIQLVVLITVLSVAPSILVMMTSFVRIIIVLGFLRSALGTQQVPPNQVMLSLALFLTFFIMAPTFQAAYDAGIKPMIDEQVDELTGLKNAVVPFQDFMLKHTRERDLQLFTDIAKVDKVTTAKDLPIQVVIPAFMISELKRSFEIGFLVFIPFLVIDMVVSSVLQSMGMMMLPPAMISLPFKIIFFVLVDGWYLIVGSLVKSFG